MGWIRLILNLEQEKSISQCHFAKGELKISGISLGTDRIEKHAGALAIFQSLHDSSKHSSASLLRGHL